MPDHYHPDPTSSQGCLPCDCNPGGSRSTSCDLVTGQCYCRTGVIGRTCSQIINNFFFPSIDFIRLEAEQSSLNPVIEFSGENLRFTGTGYASVVASMESLELGTLVVPASGLYEAVIRYTLLGITTWESLQLTVIPEQLNDVEPRNCSVSAEILSSVSMMYSSLNMGSDLTASTHLCLRSDSTYSFSLHDFVSGVSSNFTRFEIDSFFLIPISIPSADVFDAPMSPSYLDCVGQYRRVISQSSADPLCANVIFTKSTAVYNGTLGK